MAVLRQNSTVDGKLIASEDYVDDKIATGGVTVVQINSDCKTCIKCGQHLQINAQQ